MIPSQAVFFFPFLHRVENGWMPGFTLSLQEQFSWPLQIKTAVLKGYSPLTIYISVFLHISHVLCG